jgi:hypothetical protein
MVDTQSVETIFINIHCREDLSILQPFDNLPLPISRFPFTKDESIELHYVALAM